jgi:transposase
MAMGKRKREPESSFWIATDQLPETPSHPFYQRLSQILDTHDFDRLAERLCSKFYADKMGRPSLPPGVYFRLLLIGYFEGIDSERGIAWRVADSLTLRKFLGYDLTEPTPDHSTISRTRRLVDQETHQAVFDWVLQVLAKEGLLEGKTLGVDATTLEASAALRSIVRRDTRQKYHEYLKDLAKTSGIETPTREDLAKLDRKRPHKGSNEDWFNPHDPDAKITKMKDGRTHLAHKAEHAVDMETGAVVAVTLQPANRGDTASLTETIEQADANLVAVMKDPVAAKGLKEQVLAEVVADKGYHSNETLKDQGERQIRTYISEPDRGRRDWTDKPEAQKAVYANRRRIRGKRGKRLMRKRGEFVERTFAHCYDTGGMRRTHLKKHDNILKRLLIHAAGFNLGLVLRRALGWGTARGLQGLAARLLALWEEIWQAFLGVSVRELELRRGIGPARPAALQAA